MDFLNWFVADIDIKFIFIFYFGVLLLVQDIILR